MGGVVSFLLLWLAAVAVSKTVPATTVTYDTRACRPSFDHFPFCNTSLPLDDRIANLISLIHDDEKPALLTAREGGGGNPGPPGNISRLGLPEFDWGTNCMHGVQTSCVNLNGNVFCPTSFPNPVNLGASFNDTMSWFIGRAIGIELRALWRLGATEFSEWSGRPHAGLDCWSPNINILRDPRWGRSMEVPSEDPYTNGQFGAQYTIGLQEGDDPNYLQAVVTLKHWDAYSLENSEGYTRHNFSANVSSYTLQSTYMTAFRTAVKEGRAKGVMCSYNALNGVPTCASPLLSTILRDTWGFEGYVTSDTGALGDIYYNHFYRKTVQEAACVAISDGRTDMNSGEVYAKGLLGGVAQGNCTMGDVDAALYNTLKLRFQLGLFDPAEAQPYWHVYSGNIGRADFKDASLLSTRESMVLLKNDENLLPLPKGKTIAVVGPNAWSRSGLMGNYLGQTCPDDDSLDCVPAIVEKLNSTNTGGQIKYAKGCGLTTTDKSFDDAVSAAKSSDFVVMVMGIDSSIEAEDRDRKDIDLPKVQHDLITAIIATGTPAVLVLVNGAMVAIDSEAKSVSAILYAGYPGINGGQVVAETLFGDNTHLGGKTQIPMVEMEMDVGPGRTYRYYNGTPVFPMGHGLSFTTFKIQSDQMLRATKQGLRLSTRTPAEKDVAEFSVTVTNTGNHTGDEVVFFYMRPVDTPYARANKLKKQIFGYRRVHLTPGASQTVGVGVKPRHFHLAHPATGALMAVPGKFEVWVSNGVAEELPRVPVQVDGAEVVIELFPQA